MCLLTEEFELKIFSDLCCTPRLQGGPMALENLRNRVGGAQLPQLCRIFILNFLLVYELIVLFMSGPQYANKVRELKTYRPQTQQSERLRLINYWAH